jgi:hypothetical protein
MVDCFIAAVSEGIPVGQSESESESNRAKGKSWSRPSNVIDSVATDLSVRRAEDVDFDQTVAWEVSRHDSYWIQY